MANGLVRDVVERDNHFTPPVPPQSFLAGFNGSSKTGFPAVHHRSKATSAFKRARQDERTHNLRSQYRVLASTSDTKAIPDDPNASPKTPRPAEDWMPEISHTNEMLVAEMDADERARERQDIIDKFGGGIEDLMAKVRGARERRKAGYAVADDQGVSYSHASSSVISPPDPMPPSPHARAARRIRFIEPTEADVHVYESQPSSPKRPLALLPPPEASHKHDDIMPLGIFKGGLDSAVGPSKSFQGHLDIESPEEGTPEDIRRRFFPTEAPPDANPTLAWMLPSSAPSTERSPSSDHLSSLSEPRYSLSGIRLSPAEIRNLPTHLGLHHHATSSSPSDAPAGYTLPDLLMLSRSSVPAQRASILGVLAKLLRNTRVQITQQISSQVGSHEETFVDPSNDVDLNAMRRDLLDAAVSSLGEKGGVGQRGVELLWEAIVGFTGLDYGVVDLKHLAHVDLTRKKSPTPSSEPLSKFPDSKSPRPSSDIIMSLPVATILPMLRQHLIASPSARSRTHTQVLEILLVLSHFAPHASAIVHTDAGHAVLAAMLEPHLRSSFGFEGDESGDTRATPTSIHVLQALACSSRDNAVKLLGPADVLLRYITEPHSPVTYSRPITFGYPSFRLSVTLLEETLRFYDILSRYGLYSQIATIAQDHFSRTGGWILDAMRTVLDPTLVSLSCAYVSLLGTLIVCATDPHQTTPSHDILWSQVQGLGWAEWITELAELLAPPETSSLPSNSSADLAIQGLWADVFHAAAAFMEGASVNGVKAGEVEKAAVLGKLQPLFETGRGARNAVANAIATLKAYDNHSTLDTSSLHGLAQAAGLLGATMRFAVSSFGPGATDKPFQLPEEEIQDFCIRFAGSVPYQGAFALVFGDRGCPVLPENTHFFMKPLSALLVSQLKLWRRSMSLVLAAEPVSSAQDEQWTIQALRILRVLLPGDEEQAEWIMESICETINPKFMLHTMPTAELPPEFWGKKGIKLLLPFLSQSLRSPAPKDEENEEDGSQSTYLAPTSPTPQSISRCTTLNIPTFSQMREAWDSCDPDTTLPLRNDWPMLSLNHLLRSGTSPVFRALPPSWDASETDVVRASLLLARVVQEVEGKCIANVDTCLCMSPAEAIFACMKIFMLEDGQQQVDSGDEVFRDLFVTRWMEDLLKPFTYSHPRNIPLRRRKNPSLEQVSKPFLGDRTPFYQFYTDFLALYDAISFSHTLFARLLLPPVSMSYPVDYRKLLFGDFGHVLRTVKTDVPDLLCEDVRDYLWPVEHDAHVVGWYLKSLVTSRVHGLVRWLAVHHVATNIWPEFTNGHSGERERAGKLLSALLLQGQDDIVREVSLYRQREDEVWAPPDCFVPGEIAWRRTRLEWARDIAGEHVKTRLQSLLLD